MLYKFKKTVAAADPDFASASAAKPPEPEPGPGVSKMPAGDVAQLEQLLQSLQGKAGLYTHPRPETQALLELIEGTRLLLDQHYDPYIVFETPEKRMVVGVLTADFRRHLSTLYQDKYSRAPRRMALFEAVHEIETRASAAGEIGRVHLRRALTEDSLWLDLGDNQGRVVRIDKEGWRVLTGAPVYFRRYRHQLPLPVPEPGGDVEQFCGLLRVTDPGDLLLLMAWIIAAYNPEIPVPMLVLTGPRGSGKTTLARIIRRLVDPSRAEVMGLPSETMFAQVLDHHCLPIFDNLGPLTPRQSNLLCRGVTGLSLVRRRNYSDSDDVIVGERRPMILTALEPPGDAPDWLDRALVLRLPHIDRRLRFEEVRIMGMFERLQAKFLGLMMTRLSAAYAVYRAMPLPRDLPRMADFAVWGEALAGSLGYGAKMFLAALDRNSYLQNEALLERDETGQAVVQFMQDKSEWKGTVLELLSAMGACGQFRLRHSPARFGRDLRRLQWNLQQSGLDVEITRRNGIRTLVLKSHPRPPAETAGVTQAQ